MGGMYSASPVLALPKAVHRGGVHGAGGGISSTGSSASAQQWSSGLGQQLGGGDFAGALKKTVADGMNSALAQGMNLQEAASGYVRVINGYLQQGHITPQEAGDIQNFVMDSAFRMMENPKRYGGQ
jgi:hypothetical protein